MVLQRLPKCEYSEQVAFAEEPFSDLSRVEYDPSALDPLLDVGAFLARTTVIFFSPHDVINHAMFKLGLWGQDTINAVSELEHETDDESEESEDDDGDDAQETTQAEDKDQSEVPLNEEYVFFGLRLCLSRYRHQQSAPKELDFVFDAICKRLPTTVPMLTELSDNVQDILALARPVSVMRLIIYLMVYRFVKVSRRRVLQTRKRSDVKSSGFV